jgi:hypothetical protein
VSHRAYLLGLGGDKIRGRIGGTSQTCMRGEGWGMSDSSWKIKIKEKRIKRTIKFKTSVRNITLSLQSCPHDYQI